MNLLILISKTEGCQFKTRLFQAGIRRGITPFLLQLNSSLSTEAVLFNKALPGQVTVMSLHLHFLINLTCTTISRVSKIIRLASVARFPSMSASCSISALDLIRENRAVKLLPDSYIFSVKNVLSLAGNSQLVCIFITRQQYKEISMHP